MTCAEWLGAEAARFVQWQPATWPMIEDILAIDGERSTNVELEPDQDLKRSCLFTLPEDWGAARVRCLLTKGSGADKREWISTRIVVRDQQHDSRQLAPISHRPFDRWRRR
jgi:hypothetical protein